MPPEFGRFLINQGLAILGMIDEPDKACQDGDVYIDIRRQTLTVERQLVADCGQTFTDGNGNTIDASNIDERIKTEFEDFAEHRDKICSLAREKLAAATEPTPSVAPAVPPVVPAVAKANSDSCVDVHSKPADQCGGDSITVEAVNRCKTAQKVYVCIVERLGTGLGQRRVGSDPNNCQDIGPLSPAGSKGDRDSTFWCYPTDPLQAGWRIIPAGNSAEQSTNTGPKCGDDGVFDVGGMACPQ